MEHVKRKQIRLPDYDYSQTGAYFVTICIHERQMLLSEIRRGDPCGRPEVALRPLGVIAENTFADITRRFGVSVLSYVIMPNHIHFVVGLDGDRATARVAPTIGAVVGTYKSLVVNHWRAVCNRNGWYMGRIWQRNYYEHVIRNEQDLTEICEYIENNPARWAEDEYNI